MALITTSININSIKGKAGSSVYYGQKNVQCMRKTTSYNVSKKLWSDSAREWFREAVTYWKHLSENTRLQYNSLAHLYNTGNLPYNHKHISGFNLYCRCFQNIKSIGANGITSLPLLDFSNIPVVQNPSIFKSTNFIEFSFSNPNNTDWIVLVKCSKYLNLGQSWNVPYVNVYHVVCVPGITLDLTAGIVAKLGQLPADDFKLNFSITLIDINCGLAGLPLPYKFTYVH